MRVEDLSPRDRYLWELRKELQQIPRDEWTVDTRNALMALGMFFKPDSIFFLDDAPLVNCTAPDVHLAVQHYAGTIDVENMELYGERFLDP